MWANSHDFKLADGDIFVVVDHGHISTVLVACRLVWLAKVIIHWAANAARGVV